jgi:hypothetical protein
MADRSFAPHWLGRLRARNGRAHTDWADLGTAFGLDRSMQPRDEPPAPDTPAAREPWWRRLTAQPFGKR